MRIGQGPAQVWLRDVALRHRNNTCLLWPFAVSHSGYPQVWEVGAGGRGGQRNVNRVVCEFTHGAPPTPQHDAAHHCGNRVCVNPRHIRWATKTENQADREKHGTVMRGETHYNVRLTEADVLKIRKHSTKRGTGVVLAERYGVTTAMISRIRKRQAWKHI